MTCEVDLSIRAATLLHWSCVQPVPQGSTRFLSMACAALLLNNEAASTQAPENGVQDNFPPARVGIAGEVQHQMHPELAAGALHPPPHLHARTSTRQHIATCPVLMSS